MFPFVSQIYAHQDYYGSVSIWFMFELNKGVPQTFCFFLPHYEKSKDINRDIRKELWILWSLVHPGVQFPDVWRWDIHQMKHLYESLKCMEIFSHLNEMNFLSYRWIYFGVTINHGNSNWLKTREACSDLPSDSDKKEVTFNSVYLNFWFQLYTWVFRMFIILTKTRSTRNKNLFSVRFVACVIIPLQKQLHIMTLT